MRHETIHVDTDGTVTYGVEVPRMSNREGEDKYIVAAAPKRVHGQRFVPAGVPKGVELNVTLPHDCAQHLTDAPPVAAFRDYAVEVFTEDDRKVLTGGDA